MLRVRAMLRGMPTGSVQVGRFLKQVPQASSLSLQFQTQRVCKDEGKSVVNEFPVEQMSQVIASRLSLRADTASAEQVGKDEGKSKSVVYDFPAEQMSQVIASSLQLQTDTASADLVGKDEGKTVVYEFPVVQMPQVIASSLPLRADTTALSRWARMRARAWCTSSLWSC